MTIAIPYWPNRRLVVGAHTIRLKEPKLAIHSNITPGKLAGESRHILMLDYDGDGMNRAAIKDRLRYVGITNYFIYRSAKGFHVIDTRSHTWDEMRMLQIESHEDDMHHRMTERFGRAALALHHPVDFEQVGWPGRGGRESIPHYFFYLQWQQSGGNMDIARINLSVGDIAFRFYRKHSFIREVI